jgi:hypothetical protein
LSDLFDLRRLGLPPSDAVSFRHPSLRSRDSGKSLVLLGSLFNPAKPEQENADILEDVFAAARDKDSLFSAMKRYAGSPVLRDGRDTIIS